MQVFNGVEMLELSANVLGGVQTIYPTLLWDKDTAVLVDTGFPGLSPKLFEAMEKANIPLEKLSQIIITHQDIDHIGSLPAILDYSARKIEVLANEIEKPYIQGEKRILKFTLEAIAQIDSLIPADVPEERRKAIKAVFENPPKAPVDKTVMDSEELPYCGGIMIIHTPGHTPGHISLYHKQSKMLIAGDALRVDDGKLFGPQHNYDTSLAIESLKKLAEYEIEAVICYHGGMYKGDVNQRIAQIANGE
jgi:glyoxylase-like metal-dependent hydrolase (beta-lactamase superfamily II)